MKNVVDPQQLTKWLRDAGYPTDTAVALGVSGPFGKDVVTTAGKKPGGEPFTANTIAYVGSLAKQVTASCAALLIQAGQLDTNEPTSTWLVGLPQWADNIEVRHHIRGPKLLLSTGYEAHVFLAGP